MAPRRKNGRLTSSLPIMKKHRRCWRCCEPFCYGLASLTVLIAILSLAALILTLFPLPLKRMTGWIRQDHSGSSATLESSRILGELRDSTKYADSMGTEFVPCTQISVQKVWSKTFPRMNSESPVRKADLNGDDVEDIIFGFGVGK